MKPEAPPPIGPILLVATGVSQGGDAASARPDDLVLDLEALAASGAARARTGLAWAPRSWIRISPLSAGRAEGELDLAVAAAPAGLLLPGVSSVDEVEQLGAKLAVRDAMLGLPDGSTRILAVFGDDPAGILALDRLGGRGWPRLAGIVSDPAGLARALGCAPASPTIAAAEARLVIAAAAVGVVPVQVLFAAGRRTVGTSPLPPPHAEETGKASPRSTRQHTGASFEAGLRPAPQDEEGGVSLSEAARRAREAGFGAILVEGSDGLAAARAAFG